LHLVKVLKSEFGISVAFPSSGRSSSERDRGQPILNKAWKPSREHIELWSVDIQSFWKSSSWSLEISVGDQVNYYHRLASIYKRSLNSEVINGVNAIQTRHIQKFLYELLLKIYPHNTKHKQRTHVTKDICRGLAKLFFSSTSQTLEEVAGNLHDGASNGKKYTEFEAEAGEGILIVLPHPIDMQMKV
jgi:hypothetical protein